MRLWPKSLAGQLIVLLLLALVVAQAVSFLIFLDERSEAVRDAAREHVLVRTASIARLLNDTPSDLHERIVRTASTRRLHFWVDDESVLDPEVDDFEDHPLAMSLSMMLDGTPALVRVERRRGLFRPWRDEHRRGWRSEEDDDETEDNEFDEDDWRHGHWEHRRERWHRRNPVSLAIAVPLEGGHWLNMETALRLPSGGWAWPSLASMLVMASAIMVIVILLVRRITRPLRALAGAADGLGRGEAVEPLAEEGPEEVRRTTRAFNAMQDRLNRFVQDRTRMLAAVSHDLRTPITSLRLRAEFIEDTEIKAKILETLEEMQRMTEAVLAFAREEAATEETRSVDLAALIGSLCDDLAELGQDVGFAEAARTPYDCRPVSLKRALRNLIENAVSYGERARVALATSDETVTITVDDDGPGIPEASLEEIFKPFVRLEESRSRETGGVGLGLAIARSIVRGHGGELTLANRTEGGLRATIKLPR